MLTKSNYFEQLSSQISESLYLTDKTSEVDIEISHNLWMLGGDLPAQITVKDLSGFFQKVRDNHQVRLNQSPFEIDLIFYLWHDALAGQLRFNFINSNHSHLPFQCKLAFVNHEDEIIGLFLMQPNGGLIPWDELRLVETSDELAEASQQEKESADEFVLKVYRQLIKKNS